MSHLASDEVYARLRALELFKGMGEKEIRSLAELAEEVEFSAGTVIFTECEPATHCYLIVTGHVVLEICDPDKCSPISTVGPGELLGWTTVLGGGRLTATARCQEPTRAIELPGPELIALCESNPVVGYQLMKCVAQTLAGRLTATRLQLLDLYSR